MNAQLKICASDYASWILSGLALLLVLHVRLLPALIAGPSWLSISGSTWISPNAFSSCVFRGLSEEIVCA